SGNAASERPEIVHLSVAPAESMLLTRNRRAVADDVAVLVQRDGFALRPSERSEVAHLAGTPQECVFVIAHDAVGGDLATVVDRDRRHLEAAKHAEVVDLPPRPGPRRAGGEHDADDKPRCQKRRRGGEYEPAPHLRLIAQEFCEFVCAEPSITRTALP